MIARIRKELAAASGTAASAWLAAYANGGWPNWLTVGLCVGCGVFVGVVVFGVTNARPLPRRYAHLADPLADPQAPVSDAVLRLRAAAAARRGAE
jgi:hypothetical protein